MSNRETVEKIVREWDSRIINLASPPMVVPTQAMSGLIEDIESALTTRPTRLSTGDD